MILITEDGASSLALYNGGQYNSGHYNSGHNSTAPPLDPRFKVGNMVYMVVTLLGIMVSYACLAIRVASIRETHSLSKLSSTHIAVLAIYFLGSAFCVSECIVYFGQNIYDTPSCEAAIYLAIVFYLGQKYCFYLFLVERTHSVQASIKIRSKDHLYLSGLASVLVGFTTLGAAMLIIHDASFDKKQESCHIGLPRQITVTLLGWDTSVNVFLTVVFLWRCRPYMVKGYRDTFVLPVIRGILRKLTFIHDSALPKDEFASVSIQQEALLRVIRKAVWSCLGVLASTVAMYSMLLLFTAREEAWVFLTLCTIDMTWLISILTWLTSTPHDMAERSRIHSGFHAAPTGPAIPPHTSTNQEQLAPGDHLRY